MGPSGHNPALFPHLLPARSAGAQYSQQESRDGASTQGVYRVLLPDSRVMVVTYTVTGDRGYEADVQFEGEARPYQVRGSGGPGVPGGGGGDSGNVGWYS